MSFWCFIILSKLLLLAVVFEGTAGGLLVSYTNISLDPTLKWSKMTEHLRRDDANTSDNMQN